MFFTKYPHPANFSYAEGYDGSSGALTVGEKTFVATLDCYEGDVYHLRIANKAVWEGNKCLESLVVPPPSTRQRLKIGKSGALRLTGRAGNLLKSPEGKAFGVCGNASLFQFELASNARFYGMGEKSFGRVELGGLRTKFWNTDVWGDFHFAQWAEHPADPPYFSVPYIVVRQGDEYVGLLLHNPYPTFFETPGTDDSRVFVEWQRTCSNLLLGSEGGEPNLWIIYGPSLPELTRKLQKLVGVTPLPPAWSLGYHQSRWGYGGHDDLLALDKQFTENEIPCDSLWLDLDYMDGFRVFQTSKEMFPEGAAATVSALEASGRRIVPILDPGVKSEPGYAVYDDGLANNAFCKNAEGKPFVGMVWPGETVFPDFTLPSVRDWWAGYVKAFAEEGFGASWLDMNDPSTGPVDPEGMLFQNGQDLHAAHHNQYALGMQMSTREGFLRARPDERPFLLSRSGFIGSSKNAAIWTGDNVSTHYYLAQSVTTAIGMSLSGQPFSGPDVGGFGGDASEELILDWFKCAFLFPFMRNHSMKGSREQEPYAFRKSVAKVLRRYIRLRYKLFPYLYNLFAQQELDGDPILRPLFYQFDDENLDRLNDEFLIGPYVLQAPFLDEGVKSREVVLPGTQPWFDASGGEWLQPGTYTVKNDKQTTPLYIVAGAVIPMQGGTPTTNKKDLTSPHFHIFVPEGWSGEASALYRADDGISFEYRSGARSELSLKIAVVDGHLAIATNAVATGFGPIKSTFVIHGSPKSIRLDAAIVTGEKAKVTLTGSSLPVQVVR